MEYSYHFLPYGSSISVILFKIMAIRQKHIIFKQNKKKPQSKRKMNIIENRTRNLWVHFTVSEPTAHGIIRQSLFDFLKYIKQRFFFVVVI